MMNFLDLSAASEEECRLIREILADTSVVNIADPIQSKLSATTATTTAPAVINNSTTISTKSQPAAPKCAPASTTNNSSQGQDQDGLGAPPAPHNAIAVSSSSGNSIQDATADPLARNSNVLTSNEQLPNQHQPSPPPHSVHQHSSYGPNNGQKHAYRNNLNANNNAGSSNFSNASNHGHTNHIATTQNYRNNNYNNNGQRKSGSHNSGNINNTNSSNNRNRIPSMSGNVSSGPSPNQTNVQSVYPQQFTPPLPSNVIPTTLYHNINVNNINNHNSNAINSHLSHHQHQRTNEHGNERLRSMGNHMHSNNNVDMVSTSSSVASNIGLNIDQHQGSSMPLNMYNHHPNHMHHQVPPVMPTSKMDNKSNGSKNSGYHVQETLNNLQTTSSGGQPTTPSGQMPQMAGDMNSVIGMDMTGHPQGYAIQAFAPPHPHQMFSGPPIFQAHPHYSYLIPYNIPQYAHVPYVPMAPNTVPRAQIQPQTSSQTSSAVATNTSHSRNNNSINQPLNDDHYDSGHSSTATNNNLQQSKLDNSQAPDDSRTQGQASIARDGGHAANAASTPPRSGTEIQTSFDNPPLASHNQATTLQERPNKVLQSNKSANSTKLSPPAGKNKDTLSTTGDLQGPKSNHDTHVSDVNDQPTNESAQSKESKVTHPASTFSPSDEHRASNNSIEPSVEVQSSPEVSQTVNGSLNKSQSTKNATKKPQSEDHHKLSSEQVSSDSHDYAGTEAIHKSAGQSVSSKSWASLFKGKEANVARPHGLEAENNTQWADNSEEESKALKSSGKIELAIKSTSVASTKEQRSQDTAKRALDKMAHRIAMKVNTINLKHALPFLKPRGFINKGNGCYINATLQALIACPPFYNLMKEIGDLRAFRRDNSCTPILDSFAELFLHFPPLDLGKKVKQAQPNESKLGISSLQAEAIEPKCIYNVLGNIKSECLRGKYRLAETSCLSSLRLNSNL